MLTLFPPLPRSVVKIDLTETDSPTRPVAGPDRESALARHHVVDRILAMNPSATADFLDQFADDELAEYLDHLTAASLPRGRQARWVRPTGARGIQWADACA